MNRHLFPLLAPLFFLLAAFPGCTTGRTQLIATWEPFPEAEIAYKLEIGGPSHDRLLPPR